MAKKPWCIPTSHPLAVQIAEKYNISRDDAKTILNTAQANDPGLQVDDMSLAELETQPVFKKQLDVYIQKEIDTEDILMKGLPGYSKEITSLQSEIKAELGIEYSFDQVEELMNRFTQIARNTEMSQKNTKAIADIIRNFKDTRRLEFVGDWICKYWSELMTFIETNEDIRNKYNIKQRNRRKDYYNDPNAKNLIYSTIKRALKKRIAALDAEGKTDLANELRSVFRNFSVMLYMYGGRLFRDEGVEIGVDGNVTTPNINDDSAQKNDNNEGNPEDDEDEGEKPVNTFSASEQNKSVTSKIVPSIKILLSNIHDVDSHGNEIADEYGYGLHKYISVPLAINKLLVLCRGCQTYGEMISALQKNTKSTYWLNQLLSALDTESSTDVTGESKAFSSKKEQLQSMFFKSMRKQFTRMRISYISKDENGDIVIVNRDINVRHRSDKMLNSVKSTFKRGTGTELFNDGQVDFKFFDEISKRLITKRGNTNTVPAKIAEAYSEATDIAKNGFQTGTKQDFTSALNTLKDAESQLVEILNKFGIKANQALLNDYLSNDIDTGRDSSIWGSYSEYGDDEFATRYEKLKALLKQVLALNNTFQDWGKALQATSTFDNPFFVKRAEPGFVEARKIVRNYMNIAESLTEFSPDSFESRGHAGGKDYYSWNNPSSIMTIVENMSNPNKNKVQDYIKKKYCEDPLWFMKYSSTADNPRFYSDWIDEIYSGTGREIIEYAEKPLFCGHSYNDMSDISYALSMLNDYFTPMNNRRTEAWYRMLIASDKPRYSSIKFKRYADNSLDEAGRWSNKNYHNVIASKALSFYVQELRRSAEVVNQEPKRGVKIDGYDIKINNDNKHIFDKIKNKEKVTVDDVLKNGRYIFRGTGAAFYLNKFVLNEIENKTELGKYTVDAIFNNGLLKKDDFIKLSMLSEFKNAFHKYMQSIKKETMDRFNEDGLFDFDIKPAMDGEGGDMAHLKYLIGSMRQWHSLEENFAKKMYSRTKEAADLAKELGHESNFKKNTVERTLFCELAQFQEDLEEYVYNNWLAKANMSEIFDIDLAFYKDTTNFQKRNAQVISSGYTPDPDARIHGQKVANGKYRSVTIKTPEKVSSKYIPEIKRFLESISATITDENQKKQFDTGMNDILKKLKSIDPTDGQAFTGLTALRKKLAGQGEWSRSNNEQLDEAGFEEINGVKHYIYTDEAVYRRIKRGETTIEDLMHVFAQPQKPFVYSFVNMNRAGRGKITVPVQHKNSEYALVFLSAFYAQKNPESQIAAISAFLEKTAEDDITNGIDTINYDSAVKIGGNSEAIDISGMTPTEVYNALLKHVGYNPATKKYREGAVTEYDIQDYRIVQEKPEHFKKNAQPLGSQIKILAINNIKDSTECTLPNGEKITGKELKQRYFNALRRKMAKAELDFERELGLNVPRAQRIHTLSDSLKRAMSTDQKFSVEMRRALSVENKDGVDQFVLPLDETEQQSAIEAMLYSKIRRAYYKEKTNGGIVVQVTSWGESEDLGIIFDKDGNYSHFECEVPMPDYVRKMISNPDGSIDQKFYGRNKAGKLDGTWNMEEIRKVVPDSVFDCIAYRVPTEAKYSMMVGRIVRFTPEGGGSAAKYPIEITRFTGSDFDIDTTTIEIRPIPGNRNEKVDNEIFDLQVAALRSKDAAQETFKDGDFSDLRELSYKITLLSNGYTEEQVNAMSAKELKAQCAAIEDLDLMSPVSDIILHNQNTDANDMIAIAAVGVTSHAFISIYNNEEDPEPTHFTRIVMQKGDKDHVGRSFTVVNDKEGEKTVKKFEGDVVLDAVHDMDGKLIGTEISKYVGGSADAAKDAALYRLNITKRTLPILVLMHRIGVSSDVARLFISQPEVREILHALQSSAAFYGGITTDDACNAVVANIGAKYGLSEKTTWGLWEEVKHDSNLTLIYSELIDHIINNNKEIKKSDSESKRKDAARNEMKNVHIFNSMTELSRGVRNLDTFTRYNASKAMSGTTFLDRYAKRKSIENLQENLNREKAKILLPANVEIRDEYENTNYGRLCSMFPYIAQTILGEERLTEDIILDNMHTYSVSFFEAVKKMLGDDLQENADLLKDIYTGWKNFLLFVGDSRIADFFDEKTARFYTRDFANHFAKTLDALQQNDPDFYNNVIENNSFIDSIDFKPSNANYDPFDFLATEITGMSDTVKEKYKRDWESLLNYPQTRQLVIDTTIHFLARAASFSRDTPVHVMPLAIKEAIPHYTEVFENANKMSMSQEDLERFIILFARNNIDNYKVVPHFRSSPRGLTVKYDDGKIIFSKDKLSNMSNWVVSTDEKEKKFRMPVLVLDDVPYLVLNDTFQIETRPDDTQVYAIEAVPVSPLGVPEQMMEYTGLDTDTSLFEKTQDNPDGELSPTEIDPQVPIIDNPMIDTVESQFVVGQEVGTFINSEPFWLESEDEVYNQMLAEDITDFSPNTYLESRTHIRRAEKIINELGFKLASIQQGNADKRSYVLNVTPNKYGLGHEDAIKIAAILSGLGYNVSNNCSVWTYVNNFEDANAIEFSIPIIDASHKKAIIEDIEDALGDMDYIVNENKKEINIRYRISDTENVGAAMKDLNNAISVIKNVRNGLVTKGLAPDVQMESNFMTYDTLGKNDIIDELNTISNEEKSNEQGSPKPGESALGQNGRNKGWKQIGVGDLARLASRRIQGQKVDDEVRQIFNEYKKPLKSTSVSYESSNLANTVVGALEGRNNKGVYLELMDIISNKESTKRTDVDMLNSIIINTANWIIGNRPEAAILESLERTGFTEESGKDFISIIDDKLKELNIC